MRRFFLSSLLSTVALCAARQSTLVDLGYARYQGSINNQTGNIEFLGIRYAAPPTGKLAHQDHPEFRHIGSSLGRFRWREPQQPAKLSGIQQADNQPNMCWQAGDGTAPVTPFPTHDQHPQKRASPPSSEDCLFLKFVFHKR